jgi:class 3 adenylate cyclase
MEIVNYTGDGYFAKFLTVASALRCALLFQHAMRTAQWGEVRLTARVGVHVGEIAFVEISGKREIAGLSASVANRVMSLAQGGQILLTRMAFEEGRQFVAEHPPLPGGSPPLPLSWLAHGPYRFKGQEDQPVEVFEAVPSATHL